jgi:hypothetical protein
MLVRTARGEEMLVLSARVFEELREAWAGQLGIDRLRRMEDDLEVLVDRTGGAKEQAHQRRTFWCHDH